MKMNSSKVFFLSCMIIGVMMSLCSNNWLFIWCGLEMSLISFIPLMSSNMILSSESCLKYFLIQSISSSILIMGLMMMIMNKIYYDFMITISVIMKMGVAPFHTWILMVCEGLTLMPMILMFSITKVAPLMVLSFMKLSISIIISVTLMTGAILGINQSSTRKIVAYSSIFNMGLILMSINNNFVWCYYLAVYSLLILILIVILFKMNMFYTNQVIMNEVTASSKINLLTSILSLGGLPPFIGFSIKLLVIEFSINQMMTINLILMIMMSLLIMFFYLRIVYLSILFFTTSPKWVILSTTNLSLWWLSMNILFLPMMLTIKMFD
nr:NADH dehydrogenase subunit 2 [Thaia sp. 1 NZ-2023b]